MDLKEKRMFKQSLEKMEVTKKEQKKEAINKEGN